MNIRVFIADDNGPLREKMLQMLKLKFEVVGSAADGKTALEMIMLTKPDIAVLDICMPFMDGIEVTTKMKRNGLATKVIIITFYADRDYVVFALDAGASGYVFKLDMATDLVKAVRAVSEGKVYISRSCAHE